MLTRDELARLVQSLRDRKVLSVYLDGSPAEAGGPAAWRRELEQRLAATRASLGGAPPRERAAFERCVERMNLALADHPDALPTPGWVGLFPERGVPLVAALPVQMPMLVAWGDGARAAPYVRALKQHVPAIVAVAEARAATLYVYAYGALEAVETFPDADIAALVRQLVILAGARSWVFVGGVAERAAEVMRALPEPVRERAQRLTGLDARATEAQIRAAAEHVARAASRERDLVQVLTLLDRVSSGGRATAGWHATGEALCEQTVARMLFTGRFVREHPTWAEALVRLALEQEAELEYVSGAAAEQLDAVGGVGALLRLVAAPAPLARRPAAMPTR